MKRKIALFLSIVMLVAVLLPVQSFAAEKDNGLQNALNAVKTVFTIPEDYKFDYNVYTDNGKNVWYLNWTSKDQAGGNISVSVNDKGTILNYDQWKPNDYSQVKKLPKVTKQEARKIAEAFITKVNPGVLSQVRYQENNQNALMDYTYYFSFTRLVNDIPYYNNAVNVSVNRETGEVQNYNYNWTEDLVFPAKDQAIPLDKAEAAYKEKLGLRLIYKYAYIDEKLKIFPVYTPKYNNYTYAIDALTGEKVQVEYGYYGPYYAADAVAEKSMAAGRGDGGQAVLTPEELKAVEEASKLLSAGDAEKIARDFKLLGLTADYKLNYSNLSRGWPLRDKFTWSLSFNKEATEKDREYRYASVSIDARTGEIESFYVGMPYKEGATAKYDEAAAKAAVEDFLKEFKADKFAKTEYDDSNSEYRILYQGQPAPLQYSFRYIRLVNGVAFPDNSMTVEYDAVNGKVINFYMNWFDVDFPSVEKAVSIDSVYEKLFKEVGLELQYKPYYPKTDAAGKMIAYPQPKPEIKLVYSLKPGKPLFFDANSGMMVMDNGEPYKEVKAAAYTDIKGHYAEKQISTLAEYGIYLDGTEFKPDSGITQKDLLILISKALINYYMEPITEKSTQKEIDNFYGFLIREGIIKAEEKAPNAVVKREDAVKFAIRALKYDKVADIKGIYLLTFKDVDQINPDLIGYVAIASGLKMIDGSDGNFNPKDDMTRAGAAVMIYNYLQR